MAPIRDVLVEDESRLLEKMRVLGVHERFVQAVFAAQERSRELAGAYGEADR